MNISPLSIDKLVEIINADRLPAYLSLPQLIKLFNMHGARDNYSVMKLEEKIPSRKVYTKNNLLRLNGDPTLKLLIESLVDDRSCETPDSRASEINKIIKHDKYLLEKNAEGVYKITGEDLPENVLVTPVFEDIEKEVIQHINSAKYSIWVAVAWVTSKPIATALFRQHQKGVNVRVVVNNDEITKNRGIPFEKTQIEYYKASAKNGDYINLMHHKFCVIDFKKVVTGSFNWTTKASYNKENITVIEQREKAEKFADEFLELISGFKRH
jgi:phosphatidylserine/phosphatidylglycerophosphate/cardiolipin synthase-like enzyme